MFRTGTTVLVRTSNLRVESCCRERSILFSVKSTVVEWGTADIRDGRKLKLLLCRSLPLTHPSLRRKSKAGEYIDMTVGIAMGISTMAAAALGNTISDIAGVGLGGFIETMATKLGLPQNKLSRCADEMGTSQNGQPSSMPISVLSATFQGMRVDVS